MNQLIQIGNYHANSELVACRKLTEDVLGM